MPEPKSNNMQSLQELTKEISNEKHIDKAIGIDVLKDQLAQLKIELNNVLKELKSAKEEALSLKEQIKSIKGE